MSEKDLISSSVVCTSSSEGQSEGSVGSGGDILSEKPSSSPSFDSELYNYQALQAPAEEGVRYEVFDEGAEYPQDDYDVLVLAPEHPLLKNFHHAISKLLAKQKEQLTIDIKELSTKVKAQRRESDDAAEKLYVCQQNVNRQHAQLDIKTENAAANSEIREELEKCTKELADNHRDQTKALHAAQIFEKNLWILLGEKTMKDNLARKAEETTESKITMMQRQTEKAQVDKKVLIEEKRKQDEFVYRLTCQVSDLQTVLAKLNHQIAAKDKEEIQLKQAVKTAELELDELDQDQHRFSQVWQRLLVSAKNKDAEQIRLNEKKSRLDEELKIALKTNEEYKKGLEMEKEKNEQHLALYKKVRRDKAILEMQIRREQKRIEDLQEQIEKSNAMVGMTEDDIKEVKRALRSKESKVSVLEVEILNLKGSMLDLEKKILEALNEQAMQDKSVQFMINKVDELIIFLEEEEKQKAQKEMQLAQAELEVQKLKHEEAQIREYLKQQTEKVDHANSELKSTEQDLRKAQTELLVKQGKLDKISVKLAKHTEKNGDRNFIETRIQDLEDDIKIVSAEAEKMQKIILRKEVALMDKNEKVEKFRAEIQMLQRSLDNLQYKSKQQVGELEKLNALKSVTNKNCECQALVLSNVDKEMAKMKAECQNLQKSNLLSFGNIEAAVKEEESKMQDLSGKLIALGDERKQLYDCLRMLQTDQVELESNLSLANETKLSIERERGSQGEISAMKTEIHRMEVRLGQLKRAQEKLKLDLNQCVLRRDLMVDSNRVRNSKQSVTNTAWLKATRKYETLKYNNNQLKSKLDKYEGDKVSLKVIEKEINGLESELDKKKGEIKRIAEPLKTMEMQLYHMRLTKKENLEQLVHRQRIVRGLTDAKIGRYRTLCKTESSLMTEEEKQRVTHSNLISVIESLQPDFPQFGPQLHSTMAMLKSIKVQYQNLSAAPSVHETDEASSVQ
ncbi:coiled-coil domain-containing protein 40 [Cloeon dipterum]|uniref:coiled-coil domain-containing protein 40 n=1 Tax=Cloeon dipterum TaxID=197152 RepID=UPI00321FBEF8